MEDLAIQIFSVTYLLIVLSGYRHDFLSKYLVSISA